MSNCLGSEILDKIGNILVTGKLLNELQSAYFIDCISVLMKYEMKLSTHQMNIVDVWQAFERKWREKMPYTLDSRSLPVYTGSYAEGLPNAEDRDMLLIAQWLQAFDYGEEPESEFVLGILPYTYDKTHPGYVRIIFTEQDRKAYTYENHKYRRDGDYNYLSSTGFIQTLKDSGTFGLPFKIKGPALKGGDKYDSRDVVHALELSGWPSQAEDYFARCKRPNRDEFSIRLLPVYAVPVGYKGSKNSDIEWRLSFTEAEKYITKRWSFIQRSCYYLLKQFKIIYLRDTDCICSYFLKTILMWIEDILPSSYWENEINLIDLFVKALRILSHFLDITYIPNYFIPENNMISQKDKDDCKLLSKFVQSLLNSRQMNVVLTELLCEDDIEFVFQYTKIDIPNIPIRSCRMFCKAILKYHAEMDNPNFTSVIDEANLLSLLSLSIQLWNKEQCEALEDILSGLNEVVTPDMFPSFTTILKRRIAAFYHAQKTRHSKSKALHLYQKSVHVTYPCGFNDNGISGTVELALFNLLERNYQLSYEHITSIYPLFTGIEVGTYLTVTFPKWQLNRLVSERVLYEIVSRPGFLLITNTVILGYYILIRCKLELSEEMEKDKDDIVKLMLELTAAGRTTVCTPYSESFNILFRAFRKYVLEVLNLPKSSIPYFQAEKSVTRKQRMMNYWD